MKKKTKTIAQLKREAWMWFSRYVRVNAADDAGMVKCVTCNKVMNWKEAHSGHFIHASKGNVISYDIRAINPQCVSCNSFKSGNLVQYAVFLEEKYGAGIVTKLSEKKSQSPVMKRDDYAVIIDKYKGLAIRIAFKKHLSASWIKY